MDPITAMQDHMWETRSYTFESDMLADDVYRGMWLDDMWQAGYSLDQIEGVL